MSHIISKKEMICQSRGACGQGGGASPSHEPAACSAGKHLQEVTGSHSGHCVAPCRGGVTMEISFPAEESVCISCFFLWFGFFSLHSRIYCRTTAATVGGYTFGKCLKWEEPSV